METGCKTLLFAAVGLLAALTYVFWPPPTDTESSVLAGLQERVREIHEHAYEIQLAKIEPKKSICNGQIDCAHPIR